MGEASKELELNAAGPGEPFQGFDSEVTASELCFVRNLS